MSRYNWITPEEVKKRKERNKIILYIAFFATTILLSAIVTMLANNM